jgi:hypothetical protein
MLEKRKKKHKNNTQENPNQFFLCDKYIYTYIQIHVYIYIKKHRLDNPSRKTFEKMELTVLFR